MSKAIEVYQKNPWETFYNALFKSFVENLSRSIQSIASFNCVVSDSYRYINPRLLHLSKYAKKRRVRKKNAHRLIRMARKEKETYDYEF